MNKTNPTQSQSAVEDDEQNRDSFFTHFWQLIRLHGRPGTALPLTDITSPEGESTEIHGFGFKSILVLFPYLMLLGFIISFFWDINGFTLHLYGWALPMDHLLRIISVSGLIGFLTNWLAITMLFKPLERHPVLGQGLIPAQKKLIAYRLSAAVSRDLINPGLIRQKMEETGLITTYQHNSIYFIENLVNDEEFRKEFKDLVVGSVRKRLEDPQTIRELSQKVATGLEEQLKDSKIDWLALKTYSLIKGKDVRQLVIDLLHDMPILLDREWPNIDDFLLKIPVEMAGHKEHIEEILSELVYALVESFDVHAIIKENIMKLDEHRLEMLIKGTTNEQLRYIQYLGAILGAIGGLVIWSPVPAIIMLGSLSLLIWGIDKLAGKIAENRNKK